ncbi:uncharacterized protein [Medicago truncatula]|uniref:uncharacterized protein n=1 Tax=Medicago truncatula TaxID=3880 RepID=UPI000D2F2C16|nr:uncharacterized protein LOC112417517 [Medicago truncatula]
MKNYENEVIAEEEEWCSENFVNDQGNEVDLDYGAEAEGSCNNGHSDSDSDEDEHENGCGGCTFGQKTTVDGPEYIAKVNFTQVSVEDLMLFHFPDVSVAFMFYNWYPSTKGFAGRRDRVVKNCRGEVTQQTFVCHRQGHIMENDRNYIRKTKAKPKSRCGCDARCQVHVDSNCGRWYIKFICDVHNHSFVDKVFSGICFQHIGK